MLRSLELAENRNNTCGGLLYDKLTVRIGETRDALMAVSRKNDRRRPCLTHKTSKPAKAGLLSTLFLNATTLQSVSLVNQLEDLGYPTTVANSFQAAVVAIENSYPELIVLDAGLEFGSTDALLYIRNMFEGQIAVVGTNISLATSQFLEHLGITKVVNSASDILNLMPADSPDRSTVVARTA